ncbi:hypothetical protein [Pseudovibrio sp. SPO723]|uniref:hypothetical protein n=1 Tax=Nesiotobacter zosterae TaxID=392721 RepID=UPI0029C418A3|nr:hypothetical protein [Pseudovibrio sp. SPO723]MDX5593727.1 hypothetical protein [Pseudovibrio sp. SPO723]
MTLAKDFPEPSPEASLADLPAVSRSRTTSLRPSSSHRSGRYSELMAYECQLEERLAAMKRLIAAHRPDTSSQALSLLRQWFPESTLQERISVIHPKAD